MISVLFLELTLLVKVASSVLILTFLFSCLSVIIMRESRLHNYQPEFRSPLYPWVQIIGIGGCLLLIMEMGAAVLLVSACLVGEPVRYDGLSKANNDSRIERWSREGRLVPICPEVLGGLPVPRLPAEIEGADGVGTVGNAVCGDIMKIFIKVEDNKIVECKFKTFGCGAAIATSSIATEMVVGKTIEEALAITREQVADELGGLPPVKMHCSNLAADALHAAIKEYQCKEKGEAPSEGEGV